MTPLETALCNLKDELMTSGYFSRFYELVEQLDRSQEKGEKVVMGYLDDGTYGPIYDLDVNGTGYFRVTSPVTFNNVFGLQVTGCSDTDPIVDVAFPVRLVAAVPKSKTNDNSFSDHLLAMELASYLNKKLAAIQFVVSVHGKVSNYQTDRDKVWSSEISGITKQVDLNLSYISIDFTLTIRALMSCMVQNCDY